MNWKECLKHFMAGFGSIFDLSGTTFKSTIEPFPEWVPNKSVCEKNTAETFDEMFKADADALKSDWDAIIGKGHKKWNI